MAPIKKKEDVDKVKRKLFAYSPSKVALVLKAIRGGMKVVTAGRTYQVPRSTLRHKLSGRAPETSGHVGPQAVLGSEIENSLVTWVKECSQAGFPINKDGLLDSVKKIVVTGNLKNPFINNRPGRTWFLSFMSRHPDLSKKHAEYINKARAMITEEKIRKWFTEVTDLLGTDCEILKEPKRVWNCDETSFFLAPKGELILATKGEHVYDTSKNSDKENITTLFTVNATGEMAPPLTLYKYKRLSQEIVQNAPENWSIGKTDKGWMTAESFYEYIGNVFIPHLKIEGIQFPVILFLDGHKSHLSLHLSTLCRDNGVIVIALVPNTTHMLQPLDVAVFCPLKQSWLKYVRKWRIDHEGEEITKFNLPSALKDMLVNDANFADNVRAGFKTCGLYPFDPDQVNYKRIIRTQTIEQSASSALLCSNVSTLLHVAESTHLQYLESKISTDQLKKFIETYNNGLDWNGCVEASQLYKIWVNFKDDSTSFPSQGLNDSQSCLIAQSNEFISTYEGTNLTTKNRENVEEAAVTKTNNVSPFHILKSPKDTMDLLKNCIKWPEKIPNSSSTRKKDYIPSVLTSDRWKDIMTAKEKEKQDKEELKQMKKKNKLDAKLKVKQKKVKKQNTKVLESETSEDEEDQFSVRDSDDSDASEGVFSKQFDDKENIKNIEVGDFVIFVYESEHFVGKIESVNAEAVLIRAMQKSLKNWKWPEKPDVNLYALCDVKEKIKTPQKINSKREFFHVPEMAKYSEFID